MKTIPLTLGKVAIVDDEDFERVTEREWRAKLICRVWYAEDKHDNRVLMHRYILNPPKGVCLDHKSGDGLDNRKENLRPANDSQNQQNRTHLSSNTSGFRGVTWHKQTKKWQAGIKLLGKSYHLGLHVEREGAARAYDVKARELFGEFARLNFPMEL